MTKKSAAKNNSAAPKKKVAVKSAAPAKKPAASKPSVAVKTAKPASAEKSVKKKPAQIKKPAPKKTETQNKTVFKAALKQDTAPAKSSQKNAAQTILKSAPKGNPKARKPDGSAKISINMPANEVPEVRETKQPEPIKPRRQKRNHIRPSDFTLEDLDAYLEMRDSGAGAQQAKAVVKNIPGKPTAPKETSAKVQMKATSSPKNPVAAASLFDILGFNPVEAPSLEKHREKEIPRKWKKYYNMLVDLRKRHSMGAESISGEVLKRSAKEDSGDLSSYGQHLADAGSESFERDMAYNLLSNEKEMIAEIDDAIERIRNGTYGICEVTGEPIPESRLEAIPFTRCTKHGQEIKEAENRKMKSVQRSIYDMSEGQSGPTDDEEDMS